MQKEHSIRRPVAARRALEQRKKTLAVGILLALGIAGILALLLVGCGGGSSTPPAPPPVAAVQPLQVADVQNIVQAAVNSVNVDMVVAIVDRAGFVLE
jgi:PBP1b-binding outer membrane lipoprotein LpoB